MTRFSYTYDDADNMLSKVVYDARENPAVTTTTTYAYDAANELTSSTTGATTTTYAYDKWGRMTSKTDGTYTAAYGYRYGDKLYSVTSDFPNEGNVTYEYGGDRKRRSRSTGVSETWYNWDAGFSITSEEDDADGSSGDLTMTYITPNMADVAGTTPSTGTYRYYCHDHLESARSLRAQDTSLLGSYEYTPYGEIYAESDGSGGVAASITFKFTGHAVDDTTGLYFAPYRYYSPHLARWTTRDPLGMVDGPNIYAYVAASPVSRSDPLGLSGDWPVFGGTGHPNEHCVNSCVLAKVLGSQASEFIMDVLKEWLDAIRCVLTGHAGSCFSAFQECDYKDNATGRACATECPGEGCRSCCARMGVGPGTPEGSIESGRPYGPMTPLVLFDLRMRCKFALREIRSRMKQ